MIGKFKIQLLMDWVLIKVDVAEEKSEEGIVISDTINSNQKSQKGIILAIGKGKKDEPMIVKVGDLVLFGKDSGTEVSMEGITFFFIKESNIFGIIRPVNLEVI
ncbi:co-chaperone GroES [Aquimarina gracilis]|uniref:Co-chaperonin GroES n=1 Tax=Aquimarina gracilis TaxID=874422 RepID=A0ABU5ZTL3_9FLAO|nr:co-chaperone GroES [Aquimarina gracilis]MEB3345354.1 co-chaperone GroES [Aquimarina gracilis]